ncbi:7283_t:CDS:2 [Diversispora eburnea]|uniref:7283_t:CDS:1 n=2 Tax=Diversisporales TaxID=214509 RepID=A0A9N8YS38_9GLOM|nr:7283_t:CDS:2 [Diversispora eburnea]
MDSRIDIEKQENIKVPDIIDHTVPVIFHRPNQVQVHSPPSAILLISGAGGGVTGPTSLYTTLAEKIAQNFGCYTVRMDFRIPAMMDPCVHDVTATINWLENNYGVKDNILIGWSFGGAVVIRAAVNEKRVLGLVTIASQTAGALKEVSRLTQPILFIHGTKDTTLNSYCSESLYAHATVPEDRKELLLLQGDDHCLSNGVLFGNIESKIIDFCLKIGMVKIIG